MRARLAGAAERPHAGADQREEDGDQRPPRPAGCQSWNNAFGFNGKPGNYVPTLVIDQNTGAMAPVGAPRNNCLLPAALVYDPVTNPNGTRCGDPDLSTAVWGTTAGMPPAACVRASTLDNVGMQYGCKALLSGAISPEEFVTLNEKIGGFDATPTAPRRAASPTGGAADRLPRGHRVERPRTSASCRSSTRAASTSRASTTSGGRSPSVRASTARTAITTTR
jgi:hypothetical protein